MLRYPNIDVTFDGADEVDGLGSAIKGGGGCHLLEKMVASVSKTFVVIADHSKDSSILGSVWKTGVPLEVIPDAVSIVQNSLKALNGRATIRTGTGKAVMAMHFYNRDQSYQIMEMY